MSEGSVSYSLRTAVFAIGEGGVDAEPTHLVTAIRPRTETCAALHLSPNTSGQKIFEVG